MGFLSQITGKRAWRQAERTWETPAEEEVLRAAGTKLEAYYVGHQKAKVAQWVALHHSWR